MLQDCNKLSMLDISSFNTAKVTDMSYMFSGCSSLTSWIAPSDFTTPRVADFAFMFDRCTNLTTLDISSFDTSQATPSPWPKATPIRPGPSRFTPSGPGCRCPRSKTTHRSSTPPLARARPSTSAYRTTVPPSQPSSARSSAASPTSPRHWAITKAKPAPAHGPNEASP